MSYKVTTPLPHISDIGTDNDKGHPYEPTIAASGIDDTIKIFSPDRTAQEDARRGVNILDPENASEPGGPGLKSCRRMHDSYQIMSQNDVDRQGGMSDAYVTVAYLIPIPFILECMLI